MVISFCVPCIKAHTHGRIQLYLSMTYTMQSCTYMPNSRSNPATFTVQESEDSVFFFALVKIFRNRGTVLDSNNLQDQAINRALALQTFIHVPSVKTVTNLI